MSVHDQTFLEKVLRYCSLKFEAELEEKFIEHTNLFDQHFASLSCVKVP